MADQRGNLRKELSASSLALEKKVSELQIAAFKKISQVKEKVSETAKTLSPKRKIERHPWLTVTGSVVGGFFLANLLAKENSLRSIDFKNHGSQAPLDDLYKTFKPELITARNALLGFATQCIADALRRKYLGHQDKISTAEKYVIGKINFTQDRLHEASYETRSS